MLHVDAHSVTFSEVEGTFIKNGLHFVLERPNECAGYPYEILKSYSIPFGFLFRQENYWLISFGDFPMPEVLTTRSSLTQVKSESQLAAAYYQGIPQSINPFIKGLTCHLNAYVDTGPIHESLTLFDFYPYTPMLCSQGIHTATVGTVAKRVIINGHTVYVLPSSECQGVRCGSKRGSMWVAWFLSPCGKITSQKIMKYKRTSLPNDTHRFPFIDSLSGESSAPQGVWVYSFSVVDGERLYGHKIPWLTEVIGENRKEKTAEKADITFKRIMGNAKEGSDGVARDVLVQHIVGRTTGRWWRKKRIKL